MLPLGTLKPPTDTANGVYKYRPNTVINVPPIHGQGRVCTTTPVESGPDGPHPDTLETNTT